MAKNFKFVNVMHFSELDVVHFSNNDINLVWCSNDPLLHSISGHFSYKPTTAGGHAYKL